MAHHIFIEEGTYLIDEAFLFTPGGESVPLDDAILEVYVDSSDERRVRGRGLITTALIVELLEDHDRIDLLLDLGDRFKYVVEEPVCRAGKVFSREVKSLLHFSAQSPLQKLTEEDYSKLRTKLSVLSVEGG